MKELEMLNSCKQITIIIFISMLFLSLSGCGGSGGQNNAGQTGQDTDSDGVIDANDDDDDGDGVLDIYDIYPLDSSKSIIEAYALNDTGIYYGGNYPEGNNASCIGEEIDAQDCSYGRDHEASLNADTDGHRGFSFAKVNSSGELLPNDAADWDCVIDNVTGLMWEVKTNDGGLRDRWWSYSWYNSDPSLYGGVSGTPNDGICFDSINCDTEKYVSQINTIGLCGYHDWKLPNREALRSIVDYSRVNPSIDTNWFPNTYYEQAGLTTIKYWTSSRHSNSSTGSWTVDFYYGRDYGMSQSLNYWVRLMRESSH